MDHTQISVRFPRTVVGIFAYRSKTAQGALTSLERVVMFEPDSENSRML